MNSVQDFATQVEASFPNEEFVFVNREADGDVTIRYQAHSNAYSVQFSHSGRWHVVDKNGNLESATTLSMALKQLKE